MYEMTKQEALHELKKEIYDQQFDRGIRQLSTRLVAAMKVAVKALEQETVSKEVYESEYFARKEAELELFKIKQKQELCEDAISRQELLSAFPIDDEPTITKNSFRMTVKRLSPVYPKQKTGYWIRVNKDKLKCSVCDKTHLIYTYPHGRADFCPNCGSYNGDKIVNE